MTRHRRPFLSLLPETRKALIRCAEHGAATTQTLMQLAFAGARKTARGSPLLRNECSRVGTSAAQKRIKTLENEGYLGRTTVVHEVNGTPLWILLPQAVGELSFVVPPTGDVHTRIVRSRVSAGLAGMGLLTGRGRDLVGLWSGQLDGTTTRCRMCQKSRELTSTPCAAAPGRTCQLETTIKTKAGPIVVRTDVAARLGRSGLSRRLIWIDDGRPLPEQWEELAPLARLPDDPSLAVVVRPDGFDSAWSASAGTWKEPGPRLTEMDRLVRASGLRVSRGGPFGHRFVVA